MGLGRADPGQLPDRLPPLLHLLPAPVRDRGPRAPGPVRVGLRDHRGSVRAAQLHGGAGSAVPRSPAHLRHRRRRPARRHVAGVPRLLRRDHGALGDARLLRADREANEGADLTAAPGARRSRPGVVRRRRADRSRRARGPADAGATARRGRQVRRGRLRRLRAAPGGLHRDHGGEAGPDLERARGARRARREAARRAEEAKRGDHGERADDPEPVGKVPG